VKHAKHGDDVTTRVADGTIVSTVVVTTPSRTNE